MKEAVTDALEDVYDKFLPGWKQWNNEYEREDAISSGDSNATNSNYTIIQ